MGGLRIWWFLRGRLGRPLTLLRTTAEWVASESSPGDRPLSGIERHALARMRSEPAGTTGPDIDDAVRLIAALLKHGVKLEQERD